MALDDQALAAAARRAYERDRLTSALPAALPALALAIAATSAQPGSPLPLVLTGAILAAVCVFARFRGGAASRAVWPGLLAGVAPLAACLVARATHQCTGGVCELALAACFGGGVVAGTIVGLAALPRDTSPATIAFAAAIAFALGSLGCIAAGFGGVAGLAAGLAIGAIPTAVFARQRRLS